MAFECIMLEHHPIDQQLALEERLLKESSAHYVVLNRGTPPAIVMGISNQIDEVVHLDKLPPAFPIIRRSSGGGTVVVDEHTLFITFICNASQHPFPAYPEPILRWVHGRLAPLIPRLELREHDFVIGDRKCGGNALYIKKNRWLVHSSFLWDYVPSRMALLKHPPKEPSYRAGRSHHNFLCSLKEIFAGQAGDMKQFVDQLSSQLITDSIE